MMIKYLIKEKFAMKRKWITFALLLLASLQLQAQCKFRNTAFQSGEFISYNLYYNWKFVWVKAGTASMSIVKSTFRGIPAYRGSLITRGNHRVDDMFVLRDTLLCYNSLYMEPLYYRKGAREGKRYNVDQVYYTYPGGGKCHIRQSRQHTDGTVDRNNSTLSYCVYDMMSIYMRARSFVPTKWKKGYNVDFPIADGTKHYPARLRYEGKVNIKADNGHTYRCLKLAYMENEHNKGYKKIVDFFVTDDSNHLPVRLDMHLRFGSAKAFLVGMRGVRNPITSKVK
jgi:hypothetical protein